MIDDRQLVAAHVAVIVLGAALVAIDVVALGIGVVTLAIVNLAILAVTDRR